MMNFKPILLCMPICIISLAAWATVGGSQTIEVLGLDKKDQKIYLLRHFEDGRGRLPQLYYYQLNAQKPQRLVSVRSLYIDPKTKQINYDQDSTQFNQAIEKIKKRLVQLTPIYHNNVSIQLLTSINGTEPAWYDPQQRIDKWTYQYLIKSASYKSSIQNAVSYKEGLTITQAYKVPYQPFMLTTVQYLGIPFETGYSIEDPVLLGK